MTLDPRDRLDDEDVTVLEALRTMYSTVDPAPDMVTRVLFALDVDRIGIELAAITEEFAGSLGARSTEGTRTIIFESPSLRVTVAIPIGASRFLDGWLEPAGSLRIELVTPGVRWETWSDEGGRFAFESVPIGQVHLEIHPTPGSAVHLGCRVVTSIVVL